MAARLRDLIKAVRACKTAAEERAVISKECSAIRTSFKEEENQFRHRNVAKLLFIHMLGYPTHFGQMECLKLIVSPFFSDKRIGYLGLMLLLDERQEVLMLVTNSLKNDLNHPNQYIVGQALCALANISSAEIARDLSGDVLKLLASSNLYIRKKAALCALRVIRKVPELIENFVPKIRNLLGDHGHNHGTLVTAVALAIEICETEPANIPSLRPTVPLLVRMLKGLVMSGYAPEYDVNGVTDPFLQVKVLRLLRLLGTGDADASDKMSDILAQVATNTDNARNVGNAVLYECVLTVLSIVAEPGLKVLAINVLGRFLLNRDNNIRYVALNTLCRLITSDLQTIQRHRSTIVDCLRDPDISIRRRALDLVYALINESNLPALVGELLIFLNGADPEFKSSLVAKICMVVDKFATDKKWQVDTVLQVMSLAGDYVPEQEVSNLIAAISQHPEVQAYAVERLYAAVSADMLTQSLVQVCAWCLGEYAELALGASIKLQGHSDGDEDGESADSVITLTPEAVVRLLDAILRHPSSTKSTKLYVLNAAVKLTERLGSTCFSPVLKLLQPYQRDMDTETQQRACEYVNLITKISSTDVRSSLLQRMPAMESRLEEVNELAGGQAPAPKAESVPRPDLAVADLLSQLSAPSSSSQGAPQQPPSSSSLLDLLSSTAAPAQPPAPQSGIFGSIQVFERNGLSISFDLLKQPTNPMNSIIRMNVASAFVAFPNISVQAAVPKYIKLQMMPPSSSSLQPGGPAITQQIKIQNTLHGQKPVMMKLKIDSCAAGAQPTSEMVDVMNFPPNF